jgi:hypothetical protein
MAALAVVVAGLPVAPGSFAAEEFRCPPLQPSSTRQPAYQRVPGQARCEGYYERGAAPPALELISLTRGLPDLPATPAAAALQLRGLPTTAAHLIVQPLRAEPFYRMDALLGRGAALVWNAAPMLSATGLRPRDLAFLALALPQGGDTPMFVPVALPSVPQTDSAAYAVVRVSVPVSAMSWRLDGLDGSAGGAAPDWHELPDATLLAWDRLVIPIDMAPQGKGCTVDVQALDPQSRPLPLLRFVVLGPNDGKP